VGVEGGRGTEVGHGRAEEDRRHLAPADRRHVDLGRELLEHLYLLDQRLVQLGVVDERGQLRILQHLGRLKGEG
jgi:hypothetical protein